MTDAKEVAKKVAGGTLAATIAATALAKYGLNFTTGLAKVFFNGAKNLANQMAGGVKLGIGSYLLNEGEKAVNWGFDKLIAGQKALKGHLK